MKKSLIITSAVVGLFVIVVGGFGIGVGVGYNKAVVLEESANTSLSDIGVAMQGRYEKMTALIDALTNLQAHVETQLGKITDARTAYTTALQNGDVEDIEDAEETLENEFIALQVIIEDNPDTYVATSAYLGYMNEISASTNMVTYARSEYNQAVRDFNTNLRTFPNNIFLGAFGFELLELYDAPAITAGIPEIG